MNGTEPINPILKAIELIKGLKDRKRIIITVSDFQFDIHDAVDLEKIVKENKDIVFINVCYSYGILQYANKISRLTTIISDISELPKRFFEVYRQLF
jgi:uncharacterized protein with von Willebrand factor type A (vWA) domain